MIKSILAALEVLGDSPLGLMVKPIVKFIKRTNAGSVKVIEIQYDEVHLNEHKLKPSASVINDAVNKPITAPPPAPKPKNRGYSGTAGSPGSSGTMGTNSTAGRVNSHSTSGKAGMIRAYKNGSFAGWYEHESLKIAAKKAAK